MTLIPSSFPLTLHETSIYFDKDEDTVTLSVNLRTDRQSFTALAHWYLMMNPALQDFLETLVNPRPEPIKPPHGKVLRTPSEQERLLPSESMPVISRFQLTLLDEST